MNLPLWPVAASAYAVTIDQLAISFTVLIVLLAAPVFVLLPLFAIRYRRGRAADRSHRTDRNTWLEVSWALIPFLLILVFFTWSAKLYFALDRAAPGAMTLNVVAKQWMWKFQHPEGAREINDLHVPVGVPIHLQMTSEDVIHSLYLPALRLKQDVLPGRYTELNFTVDRPGLYALRCAEFCGTDHSVMGGRFIAMPAQDYARWLAGAGADADLAGQGAALFRRLGCGGCHGAGSAVRAPSLAGLYGRPVPLADGRVVIADDQYIHDSILLPNRDVVAGYQPVMPTFANAVGEEEILQLEAYLRSLGAAQEGGR